MTEPKHTPTPYRAIRNAGMPDTDPHSPERGYWAIEGGSGTSFSGGFILTAWMSEDTAAFIVRACNAHHDLVAALEECLVVLDPSCKIRDGEIVAGTYVRAVMLAAAALAKAKAVVE